MTGMPQPYISVAPPSCISITPESAIATAWGMTQQSDPYTYHDRWLQRRVQEMKEQEIIETANAVHTPSPMPIYRQPDWLTKICLNAIVSQHYHPIDTALEGGIQLRLDRSSRNTTILTENIENIINNTYIHHNRGPGRATIKTFDNEPEPF